MLHPAVADVPICHKRFEMGYGVWMLIWSSHRYFETDHALRSHWRSKVHKRRCKALREPAYTIEESERAAGLGREGKRPTTADTGTPMEQELAT